MPIIINTPSEPTHQEKLNAVIKNIKSFSARTYSNLVEAQKQGIRMVWNNPTFTAQEILDGLGSDAIKAFNFHSDLTEYIVSVSAAEGVEYTPALPTHTFTVNLSAGSITVSDDPYTP